MYGMMSITGPEGGEPVKTGVALTDISTGLFAHGAILAALYSR
jgi:succinate---hydroxymethylglutarate CoA-transferase